MASNPPQVQVEDTDEDFFDNLVNEEGDFGGPAKTTTITATSTSEVNDKVTVDSVDSDSEDVKAFANLTIDDSENDLRPKIGTDSIADEKSKLDDLKQDIGTESIEENNNEWNGWEQNIGTEFDVDNESDLNAGGLVELNSQSDVKGGSGFGDSMDLVAGKNNGSVVKEVGWSSFYADPTEQNGNHDEFSSYSDFLSDVGENYLDFPGKVEGNVNVVLNANGEAKFLTRNEESKAGAQIESSTDYGNYSQYQESQVYGAEESVNGHDLNGTAYWENMYPGWKYDANTGQWYQVNATANTQQGISETASSSDWNVISEKSELSYLNQGSHSVVGTVTETSTTENVSNWNSQVSQVDNNGYPDHMIFDPRYPGWYYDTIAQEWYALESYNSSKQSTVQAHDQHGQNGFASADGYLNNSNIMYGELGQADNCGSQGDGIESLHDKRADFGTQGFGNLNQHGSWAESYGNYNQQGINIWQPENVSKAMSVPNFGQNQQVDNIYGPKASVNNHVDQQNSFSSVQSIPSYNKANQGHGGEANGIGFQSFVHRGEFSQQFNQAYMKQNEHVQNSNDFYGSQKQVTLPQQSFQSDYQNSYAPNIGRSSSGRPPHALVTFGFGGKLIVMKDKGSFQNSTFGNQGHVEGSISVLNLMELVPGNTDASSTGGGAYGYFHVLCQQSFPGPLVGGSVGSKELNKWIDERIANCESPDMDYRKGEVLKLLLSLLKIACQHYGKLRSPFGTDTTLKESDTPELAVAKLFSSVKKIGTQYGALNHCLQNLPSEGQIRATASEVQDLLVSGRKKEALLCAQKGQLWGPALILASQLGEQFYVDTVKQMALRQLVAGSPLRTLCLLIAGQPADVFSTEVPAVNGFPGAVSQQSTNIRDNGMLDDWEENLALMTANRTKDDELVIIHLGDCLWKDKSEITAAHICYLVAEANFESYSDSARLCLIGADHWKYPRTYASPEAIQRTELYEYSKVLGNSQFSLLPFQPYKLIYANMLAEVGKVSDSLKYCQALSKSLKTGRAPQVETWRQLVLSLEERIKIHQQGGYAANLAPAKLVGKLLNFFDSTAHRVVGGLPPPAPSIYQGSGQSNEQDRQLMGNRVSGSQSTMAMSSLIPSASMEPMSEWAADGNRMSVSNRSVSEPDFGRTPRQHQVDPSMEATSSGAEGKAAGSSGTSRFSRFGFGSGLLQKTVGLVLRPRGDKQAKLGEKNKFYYDEKLKRWVEEGAEPPAEEPALAPPPTSAAFQNGTSDYNLQSALKREGSPSSVSPPMIRSPTTSEHSSGIPPLPTNTNQFSARGRMGVRSRYVDTFNQGKSSPAKSFQSPPIPSMKPTVSANAKFFVPAPASPAEQPMEAVAENVPGGSATNENSSTSIMNNSFQSPASSMTRQRFPSMDNINIPSGFVKNESSSLQPHSRRTASWGGNFPNGLNPNLTDTKTLAEVMGMPSSSFMPSPTSGGSFGDELQEVEL